MRRSKGRGVVRLLCSEWLSLRWVAVVVFALVIIGARGLPAEELTAYPVPRWHFAPIANPYFFVWWNAPAPSDTNFDKVVAVRNQTLESLAAQADRQWWLGRGVWPFGWSWGTQGSPGMDSVDDYYDYLMDKVEAGGGICSQPHSGHCLYSRRPQPPAPAYHNCPV